MDQAYSTLEVDHAQPANTRTRRLWDTEKQVAPEQDKQVLRQRGEQQAEESRGGPEVVLQKSFHASKDGGLVRRFVTRKSITLGGIILAVLILAAVLGGVLGSRHHHSTTINVSNSSSPAARSQRHIAAVSFVSDAINHTRIYFQDDVGQIMEAAIAAGNTTWSTARIGFDGPNQTAIAAAASRPGFPLEISVFYIDRDHVICDVNYNHMTRVWASGTLSAQGYTALSNSSLSAMYHQCVRCTNATVVAFQDVNGSVQIGRFQLDSWTLTALGPELNPEIGTGLALQPFYTNDQEDEIDLLYQKSDLNLAFAVWKPALENNGVEAWSLNEQIFDAIPFGTPIAAASSYFNASNGLDAWIQVLYLSPTGIVVGTWAGEIIDWLKQDAHPTTMTNYMTANGTKTYGNLAVTAMGALFAVVTRTMENGPADVLAQWQLADDMLDWTYMGNVDLSESWN